MNRVISTRGYLLAILLSIAAIVLLGVAGLNRFGEKPPAEPTIDQELRSRKDIPRETQSALEVKETEVNASQTLLNDDDPSSRIDEVKPRSYFDDTFEYAFVPIDERLDIARELVRDYLADESGKKAFELGRLVQECRAIDTQEDYELMIENDRKWDSDFDPGNPQYEAFQVCAQVSELLESEGLKVHELTELAAERGVTEAQISHLVIEPNDMDTWSESERVRYKAKGRKYIVSSRNNCDPVAIGIMANRTNLGKSWELPAEEVSAGELVSRISHYLLLAKVDKGLYADGGKKAAWVEEMLPMYKIENDVSAKSAELAQARADLLYEKNCVQYLD